MSKFWTYIEAPFNQIICWIYDILFMIYYSIKWKTKTTIQFQNPLKKILIERGKMATPNTHIHDRTLSWLCIDLYISYWYGGKYQDIQTVQGSWYVPVKMIFPEPEARETSISWSVPRSDGSLYILILPSI